MRRYSTGSSLHFAFWAAVFMVAACLSWSEHALAESGAGDTSALPLRGVVMPVYQSKLSFEQSGIIQSLPLAGTLVEAGKMLARVDDTVVKERLVKAKLGLANAQLALDQAIHKRDKAGRLHAQEVVSEMGTKEAMFAVTQAEIGLNQAKSDLRAATKSVHDCTLKAPFAGVVVAVAANLGEYVNAGAEVLRLADLSRLELSTDLQPTSASALSAGQTSELFVGDQQVGTARIRTILPMIDGASGLRRVLWTVTPKDGHVVTGSFVTLRSGSKP